MSGTADRLARFETAPAAYARPDRLAAALGLGLPAAQRLLAGERFRTRLSALLIDALALPPCRRSDGDGVIGGGVIGGADLTLATLPQSAIARLPMAFGCLRHAATIRRVILGQERARLAGAIGEDLYRLALDAPEFGPPQEPGADAGAAGDPVLRIIRDGAAWFRAWLARLPPALGRRLVLMLPVGIEPEPLPGAAPRLDAMAAWLAERWPEDADA